MRVELILNSFPNPMVRVYSDEGFLRQEKDLTPEELLENGNAMLKYISGGDEEEFKRVANIAQTVVELFEAKKITCKIKEK